MTATARRTREASDLRNAVSKTLPQRRGASEKALGPKARLTRRRLIDATLWLLGTTPTHELTIANIARYANISPATFYLYFPNVRGMLLAASQEVSQSTPTIIRLLNEEWTEENSYEMSFRLVREYVEFWYLHRSLLIARNLAADGGDRAFMEARSCSTRPMIELLSEKIGHARRQAERDVKAAPLAIANMVMMMLERVGSFIPEQDSNRRVDREQLIIAAAEMIRRAVGY